MGLKERIPILLYLLILLPCLHGVAESLQVESTTLLNSMESSDVVFDSGERIHTCCDGLDLSLPETDCESLNENEGSKSWTFPRHMMAENTSTIFKLKSRELECQYNELPLSVYLPTNNRGETSQKFLKNGYLKVGREYYPRDEYCINAKNESHLEVSVCPQNCTGSRPCIKKCCSLDKVYSFGSNPSISKGCIATTKGEYFQPVFYDHYTSKSTHDIPEPHFIEHYPSEFKSRCPGNRITLFLFPENAKTLSKNNAKNQTFNGLIYRIKEDGKIMYRHAKDGICGFLEPNVDDYCVEGVINYYNSSNWAYKNHEEELVLFLCPEAPSENTQSKKVVGMLYGVVMLVSSIFLLLTIATYFALWERQSVHGWTIVSHTVSLFFMYIFLGVAHIIGVNSGHKYLGTYTCTGIGIVTHFFFLSTFCWLFLISVDLWLTFRAFTPRSGSRSKGLGRYIKYSVCGWGIPLIIVMVGMILDKKYPEDQCHALLTPAYGKDSCFPQQKALGAYLYYPIAIMIILNLVLFAVTTYKLYLYRQSTKMATKDDKQQQFYRLFFKLFFIMGVLWVFEVISWATSGTGVYGFWVIFDMLNVLRALAVFIIFVCKRDIIFALEENYPCLKPILLPFAWCFKRRHSTHGDNSSMTRTSTLRQTISSDGLDDGYISKKIDISSYQSPTK